MPHSFQSRKAASNQSPGLAALFAAYPGKGLHLRPTLKGLRARATLAGLTQVIRLPRIERHFVPLNPGLCADAPLGHLGIKNYAALGEDAGAPGRQRRMTKGCMESFGPELHFCNYISH